MSVHQTPGRFSANDFKAMLKTPSRPVDTTELTQMSIKSLPKRKAPRTVKTAQELQPRKNRPAASKPGAPRIPNKSRPGVEQTPYRDRAAERNLGANPDYEDDERLVREAGLDLGDKSAVPAVPIIPGTPAMPLPTPMGVPVMAGSIPNPEAIDSMASSKERQQKIFEEIEKSKFLGGDEKHTHLVKGLDFALLTKTRSKLAEEEAVQQTKEEKETKKREEQEKKEKERMRRKITGERSMIEFQTSLGRRVYEAFVGRGAKRPMVPLGSGKMVFVFDFESENDLPKTQIIPGSSGGGSEPVKGALSKSIMNRLSDVISQRQAGAYGKAKGKKKEKEKKHNKDGEIAAAAAEKPSITITDNLQKKRSAPELDDVGDIFEDAGKYDFEEARKEASDTSQKPVLAKDGAVRFDDLEKERKQERERDEKRKEWMEKEKEKAKDTAKPDHGFSNEAKEAYLKQYDPSYSTSAKRPAKDTKALGYIVEDGKRKPVKLSVDANSEYGECFPDTWNAPDTMGLARGLDEYEDDGGVDDLRNMDEKQRQKEEKRRKQIKNAKFDVELKAINRKLEEKKKGGRPHDDDAAPSKRPRLASDDSR